MSVISTLKNASASNWTKTNEFSFMYIQNPNFNQFTLKDFVYIQGLSEIEIFEKNTISVDVPQLTAGELDTVLGGQRRPNIRMQELFRFQAKFRDEDGLSLRQYFESLWIATQYEYFDDIKGMVVILDVDGNVVFASYDVIINSVSPVQFDNNSSQIVEFDVQFLSPTYSDGVVTNFGKMKYGDSFFQIGSGGTTETEENGNTDLTDDEALGLF